MSPRSPSALALAALAVLTVMLASWRAEACSCISPRVTMSPGPRDEAPLNARVRLSLPATGGWGEGQHITPDAVVRLRAGKEMIAVRRTDSGEAGLHLIELVPRKPLAARTRYQVYVVPRGGREVPIGQFTTGRRRDTEAPLWSGIMGATYHHSPAECCNCSSGEPYAVLRLGTVGDDSTDDESLAYAVWLADSGGRVDYKRPPHTVVQSENGRLWLGQESTCSPTNLLFPSGARTVRMGVRVLDLAGNLSKPSEVEVELTSPVRPRK